jgi:hypothetical protein
MERETLEGGFSKVCDFANSVTLAFFIKKRLKILLFIEAVEFLFSSTLYSGSYVDSFRYYSQLRPS